MRPIVPVILSGGAGSRLWPLSTDQRPKQFLPLFGARSLFGETLARLDGMAGLADAMVVASERHASLIQCELAGRSAIVILEPVARNTAAAIALAAHEVVACHGGDALMLVMPSDHRIGAPDHFREAVERGRSAAASGRLVTFGITPNKPETGYGYLALGEPYCDGTLKVERFVEKPDAARAATMVAEGRHLWNAGIFLFRADKLLSALAGAAADIAAAVDQAMATACRRGAIVMPAAAPLHDCPDLSIDYAVMERSGDIAAVPMDPDWSDVGCWDALADLAGDAQIGPVAALDSHNLYLRSDGTRLTLLGVNDLIVIAAGNDVLIMPRGRSQEVRKLRGLVASSALAEDE